MTYGYQYDSTGSRCAGKAQPGALALRDGARPRYRGCMDWGIYVCRATRTGSGLSTHGEGRGWDAGFPGLDSPEGTRLATDLVAKAPALGVQRVIWSDRQWDSRARAWRSYGKKSNNNTLRHRDHVHVELCWAAARGLTRAQVIAALGGQPAPPPPPPIVAPIPQEDEMVKTTMHLSRPGVHPVATSAKNGDYGSFTWDSMVSVCATTDATGTLLVGPEKVPFSLKAGEHIRPVHNVFGAGWVLVDLASGSVVCEVREFYIRNR